MNASSLSSEAERALDAIERAESASLAWGIAEVSFTRAEMHQIVGEVSDEPALIMQELLDRGAVLRVPSKQPARFRSRMAEGVRLFADLRQQFPGRLWRAAKPLVADFRFVVRPRLFPDRRIHVDDVIERLHRSGVATAQQAEVVQTILSPQANDDQSARLLSEFQVAATCAILASASSHLDDGVIVTAGTGSGKTLAFYLPALARLAGSPVESGSRAIAVYPRNELLKDQLRTALREVRALRHASGGRWKVSVGAYFGPVPHSAGSVGSKYFTWRKVPKGWVCPYLRCPGAPGGRDECGGELVWETEDRNESVERLTCVACRTHVEADEFRMTRESIERRAPTILFTTTEMVNRLLRDPQKRSVVGAGVATGPELVLLDEVHTYGGIAGAQNAYLLRRWRHSLTRGTPVTWIGLSATLNDAASFFSTLTGVPHDRITEVAPRLEEMIPRGHEYQLLLRGDPSSQAALLSTSIQSLMLMTRLLDPAGEEGGPFGSKTFAFTDTLDLVNRLYFDLRDAEGYGPQFKEPLARLRVDPDGSPWSDWRARDDAGQVWWFMNAIHRDERAKLGVGRTSSQDSGVLDSADVIVATAALEVGYDDPSVGAVLQHKAPRSNAALLQRRGRAGRSQAMRPWTVVVLSDYGRDRAAYQAYEHLLDPVVDPQRLPMQNRAVLRMQAAMSVLDWLASTGSRRGARHSVNDLAAGPQSTSSARREQAAVLSRVAALLDDQQAIADLQRWLERALALSQTDVERILWTGPRAVLLEAISTLERDLTEWVSGDAPQAKGGQKVPLPGFIPSALFKELSLPEVAIVLPRANEDSELEPLFQTLRELAPGNATLRWAVKHPRAVWIAPPDGRSHAFGVVVAADVGTTMLDGAPAIDVLETEGGEELTVFRPVTLQAVEVPADVQASSAGRLRWRCRFDVGTPTLSATPRPGSKWERVVENLSCYLQAGRGGAALLRAATGGDADVRRPPRSGQGAADGRVRYEFHAHDAPCAVGDRVIVDAIRVDIRVSGNIAEFRFFDKSHERALRREFAIDTAVAELREREGIGTFLAAWVAEFCVAAYVKKPAECSVAALPDAALAVFDASFGGQGGHRRDGEESENEALPSPALRGRLEEVLQDEVNVVTVLRCIEAAREPTGAVWLQWLQQRYVATVAAAMRTAMATVVDGFDADTDLDVDIEPARNGVATVWFSDAAIGGGAMIEEFVSEFQLERDRFWDLAAAALEASDIETAALDMEKVAGAIRRGGIADSLVKYRSAVGHHERLEAWREVLDQLKTIQVQPSHALRSAMSLRVARSGSSAETDELLNLALSRWNVLEQAAGMTLDHRSASAVLATEPDIAGWFAAQAEFGNATPFERASLLYGFLWPRSIELRASKLSLYSRFDNDVADPDRLIVDVVEGPQGREVTFDGEDSIGLIRATLEEAGRCEVVSQQVHVPELRRLVEALILEPIDAGWVLMQPRIVRCTRVGTEWRVVFELPWGSS